MDVVVDLVNLSSSKAENSIIYQAYQCAIKNVDKEEAPELLSRCADCITQLSDITFDFERLKSEAKILQITRRNCSVLADDVCKVLGEKIEKLCEDFGPIIVHSSELTENDWTCTYANQYVAYSSKPLSNDVAVLMEDDTAYNVMTMAVKKTPYYEIWATLLEQER